MSWPFLYCSRLAIMPAPAERSRGHFQILKMFLSNNSEIEHIEGFPVLSHIILGYVPFNTLRSTKSESSLTNEKKLCHYLCKILAVVINPLFQISQCENHLHRNLFGLFSICNILIGHLCFGFPV